MAGTQIRRLKCRRRRLHAQSCGYCRGIRQSARSDCAVCLPGCNRCAAGPDTDGPEPGREFPRRPAPARETAPGARCGTAARRDGRYLLFEPGRRHPRHRRHAADGAADPLGAILAPRPDFRVRGDLVDPALRAPAANARPDTRRGPVDRCPARGAGLGEKQRAAREDEACQRKLVRHLLPGRAPAQPAGDHQMDYDEQVIVETEDDSFAKSPKRCDTMAFGGVQRRLD